MFPPQHFHTFIGTVESSQPHTEIIKLLCRPYKSNLVRLHTDKESGKPKGYAHIHFPDAESLEK